MRSLHMARYFFISALFVLVAALAWMSHFRSQRK